MVDRLEREALVEYQLAVYALLAGRDVTPVTVDDARARFDRYLLGEPDQPAATEAAGPIDDLTRLHRILGVA